MIFLSSSKGLFNHNESCPEGHVEGNHKRFSISIAYFLSAFYMFRMLTKKTIKQFHVITVPGKHVGFLYITMFALY